MRTSLIFLAAAAMLWSGCSPQSGARRGDASAMYHLRLADSLEQVSALQEAAGHYTIIIDQYQQSTYYPVALRKAALLYASEYPSPRNDSLAMSWLSAYLRFPLKKPEREEIQTCLALLQRIHALHGEIMHQSLIADSLSVVTKKQAATLSSSSHRIQDLEAEIQQTQRELKKMKEIDVQLSKSRVRK